MNDFDANKRIKELRNHLGLSRDDFAIKAGFKSSQLANIEQEKMLAPAWYIQSISETWPEYGYWIATGKELPSAGQISPMTEETRQKLHRA